jgi:meromycolic acid enoyl-[acyl-carrier protein] reductase
MGILDGKRILVTGVLTDASIAFHVARQAQLEGATVVLTGYGRLSLVERIATRLPQTPPVVELDVTDSGQLDSLADRVSAHVDGLDGLVHAIAFAPQSALGGNFLHTQWEDVATALHASTYSLKSLAVAALPLMTGTPASTTAGTAPGGSGGSSPRAGTVAGGSGGSSPRAGAASIVGLDFDASRAWPVYDWMGVAKAGLESCARYLARDLGGRGIRVNLVAAGPLRTMAAKSIPGFPQFEDLWHERAPLGWDITDPKPAALACVALLSDWFPATTGEIVHVDGGAHAIGA